MSFSALEKAWSDHSQLWKQNLWVYPVISRRAKGLSIGINLNLDKRCSFDCAYCQVDRTVPGTKIPNDLRRIESEIELLIESYRENGLADFLPFRGIERDARTIQDICLSGDGESTLSKEFPEVCRLMRKMQDKHSEYALRLTLITNSSFLHLPDVQKGLSLLTEKRGEIWAKLDAGSDSWYRTVDRSRVPLERIQRNLECAVEKFPLRIQTMLCQVGSLRPDDKELHLYIKRLQRIYEAGPRNFLGVQLYGVVRHTAVPDVHPLERRFLESAAEKIRAEVPVLVEVF